VKTASPRKPEMGRESRLSDLKKGEFPVRQENESKRTKSQAASGEKRARKNRPSRIRLYRGAMMGADFGRKSQERIAKKKKGVLRPKKRSAPRKKYQAGASQEEITGRINECNHNTTSRIDSPPTPRGPLHKKNENG